MGARVLFPLFCSRSFLCYMVTNLYCRFHVFTTLYRFPLVSDVCRHQVFNPSWKAKHGALYSAPWAKYWFWSDLAPVTWHLSIPGLHIVSLSRDIFDHKRCQQVRLIALSNNHTPDSVCVLLSLVLLFVWFLTLFKSCSNLRKESQWWRASFYPKFEFVASSICLLFYWQLWGSTFDIDGSGYLSGHISTGSRYFPCHRFISRAAVLTGLDISQEIRAPKTHSTVHVRQHSPTHDPPRRRRLEIWRHHWFCSKGPWRRISDGRQLSAMSAICDKIFGDTQMFLGMSLTFESNNLFSWCLNILKVEGNFPYEKQGKKKKSEKILLYSQDTSPKSVT